jgi:TATA-box binding protein (TBP) (component of TFIID and TFIIIB)
MDAPTIMTIIGSGLKLVDQFREMVLKRDNKSVNQPSNKVEQAGATLQVSKNGNVYQTIEAKSINMNNWDKPKYEALNKRIETNWHIYNDLFANEAGSSVMEGAKIREQMRKVKEELCRDFKEMIKLYQTALGVTLPDHYQLYEVCS